MRKIIVIERERCNIQFIPISLYKGISKNLRMCNKFNGGKLYSDGNCEMSEENFICKFEIGNWLLHLFGDIAIIIPSFRKRLNLEKFLNEVKTKISYEEPSYLLKKEDLD